MDLKSKVLYGVVLGGVLALTAGGVYRYAIAKDFLIEQDVWCDAEAGEQCFYSFCTVDDWWWPCTGDQEADIWVYKRVTKPYADVGAGKFDTACLPGETIGEDEFCPEIDCEEGDASCTVKYCDQSIDDNCYTLETMDAVNNEWLSMIRDAGIEPVLPEEDATMEEDQSSKDVQSGDEGSVPVESSDGSTNEE